MEGVAAPRPHPIRPAVNSSPAEPSPTAALVADLAAALLAGPAGAQEHAPRLLARLEEALAGRTSVVIEVRFTGLVCAGIAPGPIIPEVIRAASLLIVQRVQRLGFTADAGVDDLAAALRSLAGQAGSVLDALRQAAPGGVYVATAEGAYRPAREAPSPDPALPPAAAPDGEEDVELADFELLDPGAHPAPTAPPPPTPQPTQDAGAPVGGLFDLFRTSDSPTAPLGPLQLTERLRAADSVAEWDRLCQDAAPELLRLLDRGHSPEAAELVQALVGASVGAGRPRVFRDSAAQALRRAINPRSVRLLAELLVLLEPAERENYLRVLSSLGEGVRDALLSLLVRAESTELRRQLFAHIAADPDGGEWLRGRFRTEQGSAAAMRLLQTAVACDAGEAVRWLRDGLQHPSEPVRAAAAQVGGELGDPRAVRPLVEALTSLDAGLRGAAAEALGAIGDAASVPFLARAAAGDPEPEVQLRAITALGVLGAADAVAPLLEIARKRPLFGRGRMGRLRTAAAGAIGAIEGPVALAALQGLAGERDAEVAGAARSALQARGNNQGGKT